MSKIVESEEYLNTDEVMTELGASKKRFYSNVKPQLKVYQFGGKKAPWYKKREVLALKSGQLERTAPITISGILQDWTTHVRALGYQIDTKNREIKIVQLPDKVTAAFGIASERQFVMRSRISFVNRVPICIWTTYYPLELVKGDILEEMKRDEETDVVKRIKEQHGIVIGWSKDRYTARTAITEEQELLQLLRDDPVLILQRVSYTRDKKTLVLYSHMTLLGSWFAPEHEYEVNIWEE